MILRLFGYESGLEYRSNRLLLHHNLESLRESLPRATHRSPYSTRVGAVLSTIVLISPNLYLKLATCIEYVRTTYQGMVGRTSESTRLRCLPNAKLYA